MPEPRKSFATETTISYQLGDTDVTLNVAAGTTLTALAKLINDDKENPGLTASVIDSGEAENPYVLVLQANNMGEDNRIAHITELHVRALSKLFLEGK